MFCFGHFCIVCLNNAENLINLDVSVVLSDENISLLQILRKINHELLCIDDIVPKYICHVCKKDLITTYAFHKKCRKSIDNLNNYITKLNNLHQSVVTTTTSSKQINKCYTFGYNAITSRHMLFKIKKLTNKAHIYKTRKTKFASLSSQSSNISDLSSFLSDSISDKSTLILEKSDNFSLKNTVDKLATYLNITDLENLDKNNVEPEILDPPVERIDLNENDLIDLDQTFYDYFVKEENALDLGCCDLSDISSCSNLLVDIKKEFKCESTNLEAGSSHKNNNYVDLTAFTKSKTNDLNEGPKSFDLNDSFELKQELIEINQESSLDIEEHTIQISPDDKEKIKIEIQEILENFQKESPTNKRQLDSPKSRTKSKRFKEVPDLASFSSKIVANVQQVYAMAAHDPNVPANDPNCDISTDKINDPKPRRENVKYRKSAKVLFGSDENDPKNTIQQRDVMDPKRNENEPKTKNDEKSVKCNSGAPEPNDPNILEPNDPNILEPNDPNILEPNDPNSSNISINSRIKDPNDISSVDLTTSPSTSSSTSTNENSGYSPRSCRFCPLTFETGAQLKRHIYDDHHNKFNECIQCAMTFSNRYKLRRHIENCHTGINRQSFEICRSMTPFWGDYVWSRPFFRSDNFRNRGPINCEFCNKVFYSSFNLNKHYYLDHNR